MAQLNVRIVPERIREAREATGLTDESFAEAIGVSRQAVGQYETGQMAPSGDVMRKIIDATRLPPDFFTWHRRRGAERFRMPNWRSLKRMQRPDRLRIARRLEWTNEITAYIEEFVDLPPVDFPAVEFDFDKGNEEEIEAIAQLVRKLWGLGSGPIHDLPAVLEYHGVILVEEDVDCADMDAVSRWQNGRPFILYAAETKSVPRKTFNLAHELGHLILHASVEVNSKILDKMEKQANRFASAFLLPRPTFSREVVSTSIEYFTLLKERWHVAIAAMVYRCKDLKILNTNQVQYLWRQMNARGIRKREPLDDAFSLSSPTVLATAVRMIVESKVQSHTAISEAIALNLRDIESLCGLESGYLETTIVPFVQPIQPNC